MGYLAVEGLHATWQYRKNVAHAMSQLKSCIIIEGSMKMKLFLFYYITFFLLLNRNKTFQTS